LVVTLAIRADLFANIYPVRSVEGLQLYTKLIEEYLENYLNIENKQIVSKLAVEVVDQKYEI